MAVYGARGAFPKEMLNMNGTIRLPLQIAVAALSAGLLLSAGSAPAAPPTSASVVKATAVAGRPGPDGKQVVTLTLAVDKGWHIYANPVGWDGAAAGQTVVTVKAKGELADVKVDYPRGKEATTEDIDANGKNVRVHYFIYEDKATIPITVTRAKGDDSPLELTVAVQACNENSCLIPKKLKVTAAAP